MSELFSSCSYFGFFLSLGAFQLARSINRRAGRELWYDGYQTASGRRLYNTHFVVGALSFNQI